MTTVLAPIAQSIPANPFLSGAHTPMEEELTIENLPVTGAIPAELDGRYLRIGPNPVEPPTPATTTGSSATA